MQPAHQHNQPSPADRERPSSPFKFPLALAGHIGYLLTLVILVAISLLVLLPLAPFPRVRRRLSSTMLRGYLRFFVLWYLPACRACRIDEVAGQRNPADGAPVIYVANHRSSIDAILLLALLPPSSLVIKARHVRKLGYACMVRFFDFVPIAAGELASIRQAMEQCKTLLADGRNLLIFPEGRRNSFDALMPFSDLAFRMAVEHGTPIVPIALHSDQPFLNRQKGSYFPPRVVRFRIHFLDPITPSPKDNASVLADSVAHKITAELERMDQEASR